MVASITERVDEDRAKGGAGPGKVLRGQNHHKTSASPTVVQEDKVGERGASIGPRTFPLSDPAVVVKRLQDSRLSKSLLAQAAEK